MATRWAASIDFGGTLTDVVVRPWPQSVESGEPAVPKPAARTPVDHLWSLPSQFELSLGLLDRILDEALARAGADPDGLEILAVTGGRARGLPDTWRGARIVKVGETDAIAAGGLASGGETPILVVSLGTGTALVVADPVAPPRHLIGSGIGGGTLVGLSRLLLGTGSVTEISALSAAGDPGGCDLLVGDILGGGIGAVPAEATAAHFGKLGRVARPERTPAATDLAAAIVNLVGQAVLRLAFEAAMANRVRSMLLLGHLLDVSGFRQAISRIPQLEGAFVRFADDPGFAVARGALAVALAGEVR